MQSYNALTIVRSWLMRLEIYTNPWAKGSILFWIATQALTLAYNGNDMTILANHAVKSTSGVQRHSYPLFSDTLGVPSNTSNSLKNTLETPRTGLGSVQQRPWRICATMIVLWVRSLHHSPT